MVLVVYDGFLELVLCRGLSLFELSVAKGCLTLRLVERSRGVSSSLLRDALIGPSSF